MSSNEHLLDHFSASKETKELGLQILRLSHVKTGPGSGRELKNYQVGLPAACMLIACEQLNTTEVAKSSAQKAACLTGKEFKKVYDTVKAILAEQEQASNYSYAGLHSDHNTGFKLDVIKQFLNDVEDEVIQSGYASSSNLTKCSAYFWTVNCIKPQALASTETFAVNYDLPLKKFINVLNMLNDHGKPIRKKIQSELKTFVQSPSKPTATSTTTRGRDLLANTSPPKASTSTNNDTSPVRRSSRTSSSVRDISLSPTKRSAPLPWRKGVTRELPTNDSPKRTPKQVSGTTVDVEMDSLPETPSKRRKLESPIKSTPQSAFLTALATPGSSRVLKELSHKKGGLQPTRLFPTATTPGSIKRKQDAEAVFEEHKSSDEGEAAPRPRRRFRPVYLEHQQWNLVDPRVAKIWKQAEKRRAAPLSSPRKTPVPSRRLQVGPS